MAGKEKKNRKFGRNKKSPAAKLYLMVKKADTNGIRKLKKHLRNNPNDKQNADILKAGGSGPIIKFKKEVVEVRERLVLDKPVVHNFKKANRLYLVIANGVTLDVGPHYNDVKRSFEKCNSAAAFCRRDGSIITIMETKRSTPLVKSSYKLREFLKNAS